MPGQWSKTINWKIGDRIQVTRVSPAGFRRIYKGTVRNILPHDIYAIHFDGNKIGATQNILGNNLSSAKE